MRRTNRIHYPKVFYRPIEAAIRWSDLTRHEPRILAVVGNKRIPDSGDFPRWPLLRLNTERILDGIANGELRFGIAGITQDNLSLVHDANLTIRHVDLKVWMSRYYPDQRPAFLFDALERQLHPAIALETVQALLADREALKLRLAEREHSFNELRTQHQLLSKQSADEHLARHEVTPRSETTYLNIVGGLLTLLLGKSPRGTPYSSFQTMEAVISAILANHEGRPGISERTLWQKLAAAKRHISAPTD